MAYLYLIIAIAAEIAGTSMLKYSEGFTKLNYSIGCIAAYVVCYYTFSKALGQIHLGIAYATWCGVGIIVTALLSWLLFHEKLTPAGIVSLILIVVGCICLNLFGTK